MIFAGPVPPPVLGSALASARIHLSDELGDLQARLRERIAFCNHLLLERGLPLASTTDVPVRFVGMGLPRAAQHLAARLMNDGQVPGLLRKQERHTKGNFHRRC